LVGPYACNGSSPVTPLLLYPSSNSLDPSRIVQSTAGSRLFDLNSDGWAHYGMMPDFLQGALNASISDDPKGIGLEPIGGFQPVFRSAEDFIESWEKSCRIAAGLGGGTACN
jgi:hypothetical protein